VTIGEGIPGPVTTKLQEWFTGSIKSECKIQQG
jgi:hypothetical protein